MTVSFARFPEAAGAEADDRLSAGRVLADANRLLASIVAGTPACEILSDIVATLEGALPGVVVVILPGGPEDRRLPLATSSGLPSGYAGELESVALSQASCFCPSTEEESEEGGRAERQGDRCGLGQLAASYGFATCWSVPITVRRPASTDPEFLGVLALHWRIQEAWNPLWNALVEAAREWICCVLKRDAFRRSQSTSEERYRQLFENMDDGLYIAELITDREGKTVDWRVLDVNPTFCRTLGMSQQEATGALCSQLFPNLEDFWVQAVTRVVRTREPASLQGFYAETGHHYQVHLYSPAVGQFACIFTDITERKLAEEQLRLSDERYRLASLATHDVIWDYAPVEGTFVWNHHLREAFGHDQTSMASLESWLGGIHADDRESIAQSFQAALVGSEDRWEANFRFRRADGSWADVETRAYLSRNLQGAISRVVGAMQDVSPQKQSESRLLESEERLRVSLAAAGSVAFVWDFETDEIRFDRPEKGGSSRDQTQRQQFADLLETIHPEDKASFVAAIAECLRSDGLYRNQYRVKESPGTVRWIEDYGTLIRDRTGHPLRLNGISLDVTDRKQAHEERELWWTFSPDSLCVLDLEGSIRQVNPAWTRSLGWTAAEVIDQSWIDFVHPEDRECGDLLREALTQGQPALNVQNRFRTSAGSYRWFSWNAFARPEFGVMFAVGRDVTEQKELQEQLRVSQKMEAVGKLAGGIAHDFNNVLSVISGYGRQLEKQLAPGSSDLAYVEEILKATQSASEMVRQLLAFSRQQHLQPVALEVHDFLEHERWLWARLLGPSIRLQIRPLATHPTILVDRAQMSRLLLNLIVNARDAMEGGGELRIETADDVLHDATAGPAAALRLTVSDTGCGMDEATRQKVFEPFFSTKPIGQGTGLGLATVYGIVQQSGGRIDVETALGHGTTFHLRFPSTGSAPAPQLPERQATSTPRQQVLLLVEDFEPLRGLLARVLRSEGYHVLDCADGLSALAAFESLETAVDLMITDVRMPGMNGTDLARTIRQHRPALPILFLSGFSERSMQTEVEMLGTCDFIQKPFDPGTLLGRVREILATSDESDTVPKV